MRKYFLFFLLILTACSPEPLPVPMTGEPLFKISGTIDSENFSYTAGVNDYYMDSSFEKDTSKIFTFSGAFKKTNCTNCTEELSINIRDRKTMEPGNNFVRDLSFQTGFLNIEEKKSTPIFDKQLHQLENSNFNPPDNLEYTWVFNNVDTTRISNPIFRFPDTIDQTIQLIVKDLSNNCTDVWEQGVQFFESQCSFLHFSYDNYPTGDVEFILPFPDGIVNSSWDFGDNTSGQYGNETIIFHDYSSPGTYIVCVDLELINGCSINYCSKINSHEGVNCAAGFNYIALLSFSQFSFSTVAFEWISAEGKMYSSLATDLTQADDNFFEIIEVSPFEENLEGEKTMKITARAKVTLFNIDDTSDAIILETEELIFAAAYPDL